MRLLTNDPACPELVLELVAMGKSPLQVFPGEELTVSILAEEVPPQTVLLRTNYDPELKLTSIRCSAPYLRCQEVTPDVPDGDAPARYKAVQIAIGAKGFWGYEPERVEEWANKGDFTPRRLRELSVFVAVDSGS